MLTLLVTATIAHLQLTLLYYTIYYRQFDQGDVEQEGMRKADDDDVVLTANFIPSASTCINRFHLPRPDEVKAILLNIHLPDEGAMIFYEKGE